MAIFRDMETGPPCIYEPRFVGSHRAAKVYKDKQVVIKEYHYVYLHYACENNVSMEDLVQLTIDHIFDELETLNGKR